MAIEPKMHPSEEVNTISVETFLVPVIENKDCWPGWQTARIASTSVSSMDPSGSPRLIFFIMEQLQLRKALMVVCTKFERPKSVYSGGS